MHSPPSSLSCRGLFVALGLCAGFIACSEAGEPPPFSGDGEPSPIGGGSKGGGNGTAGSPSGGETAIEGSVVEYLTTFFDQTIGYTGLGAVAVQTGRTSWIRADYDGTLFETTSASRGRWLGFLPVEEDRDVFMGVLLVGNGDEEAGVVRRTLLQELVALGQGGATLEPNSGHLFVSLVDRGGTPVDGVIPSGSGASAVLYSLGYSWSGTAESTSSDGVFFALNVPATSFPGSILRIDLIGSVTESIDMHVAADTLTIAQFVVDL